MAPKVEISPPLLEPARRSWPPWLILLALAALIAGARLAMDWNVSILRCSFKKLTGLPCFTCGGTRSLSALGHLHFAEAFWFNPLVFLTVIGAVIWTILPQRFKTMCHRLPLWKLAIAAAILNWIYLLRYLPR